MNEYTDRKRNTLPMVEVDDIEHMITILHMRLIRN